MPFTWLNTYLEPGSGKPGLFSMKPFDALVDWIEKLQIVLGVTALTMIACIIPVQVFYRYILSDPLLWPEDIAKGLLVWLGFMGAAVLHKRSGLVTVEFFTNYFTEKISFAVTLILDILIALLSMLIIIYGYRLNSLQMMSNMVLTEIPRGYFFSLPLLVNSIALFIYSLHKILGEVISKARH